MYLPRVGDSNETRFFAKDSNKSSEPAQHVRIETHGEYSNVPHASGNKRRA